MRYRKKPVEVEAMLFNEETKQYVYNWVRGEQMNIQPSFDEDKNPILIIPTLEGEVICAIGDYLIKEPFPTDWRKFYPCKPDIFAKTYEPESSPPTPKEQQGEEQEAFVWTDKLVEDYARYYRFSSSRINMQDFKKNPSDYLPE